MTETIVKYAERASQSESRVRNLERRLSMLEMGSTASQAPPGYAPQPPPHTAHFAPAAPTFQAKQPPQTIAFQPHPQETQWMPAQQQQWVPQCPRQSGGSRALNAGKRRKRKARITIRISNSGSKISEPAPTWPTNNTSKVATHNHQTNDGRLLANKDITQDNDAVNSNL